MANQNLFQSHRGPRLPRAETINEAGGRAFAFSAEHALAQLAATGCLHGTYHASAERQLSTVLELAAQVDTELLAQTAIFARRRGFMKDMRPGLRHRRGVRRERRPRPLARPDPRDLDLAARSSQRAPQGASASQA